jgi:hypothetical protein
MEVNSMNWLSIRTPLRRSDVDSLEKELRIKLPDDYKEQIGPINGGALRNTYIKLPRLGEVPYSRNVSLHKGATAGIYDLLPIFNCEEITLFINGREIESRKVERFDAPLFNVEYEEGEVSVKGVRDGKVYSDTIKTAGKEKALITDLVLSANDDKDIAIYEITAVDKNGIVCPLSNKEIEIDVTGATIVGVGNGDPSYYGYEQKPDKEKSIIIRTFNYEKGTYSIPPKTPNLMWDRLDWLEFEDKIYPNEDDYRLVAKYGKNQVEEKFTFTTTVDGVQGYEYIEFERLGANATVYINGKYVGNNVKNGSSHSRPYRFYYKFRNGKNEIKVVSEKTKQHDVNLDHISGLVKIGKVQKEPWNIPMHYGKARVFVKTDDITKAKIKVKFTITLIKKHIIYNYMFLIYLPLT